MGLFNRKTVVYSKFLLSLTKQLCLLFGSTTAKKLLKTSVAGI